MNVKDLRVQCRRAGVSPAGGREALQERLQEAVSHGFQVDVARPGTAEDIQARSQMYARAGAPEPRGIGFGAEVPQGDGFGTNNNNYSRPDSQNVGNFLTDRPSSRAGPSRRRLADLLRLGQGPPPSVGRAPRRAVFRSRARREGRITPSVR